MRKLLSIIAGLSLFTAAPAFGALISEACFGDSYRDLSPSAGCRYIYDENRRNGAANDSASALNSLSIFGQTNWELFGKQEEANGAFSADGSNPFNLVATNTATGSDANRGRWSFLDSAWDVFAFIALVMKDGNNAPTPPQSRGNGFYIFDIVSRDFQGTWETTNTFQGANLSHLSAYGVRGSVTEVPTPGVLALMGIGLVSMGLLARRRG